MIDVITENDEKETADLLIGRRIVKAEIIPPAGGFYGLPNSGVLTLDDGTVIEVIPNEGGCSCGAGDYELVKLAAVNNVITSVRLEKDGHGDQYGDFSGTYRIFVIADNEEINVVAIEGDDGSGYYGTGYVLHVKAAA